MSEERKMKVVYELFSEEIFCTKFFAHAARATQIVLGNNCIVINESFMEIRG